MTTLPKIGITLGDPAGIGPEIVAAAIAAASPDERAQMMIFGDASVLERAYIQASGERLPGAVQLVDRGRLSPDQAIPGRPTEATGAAQVAYLEAAVAAIRGHSIAGLVTAPINKRAARRAGFEFPGHTEFLAERLGAPDVAMMFAGPSLKVALATVHCALAEVSSRLTSERVARVTELLAGSVERDFGVGGAGAPVRVGVVGLNPHAGEQGLFGSEEADVITPAIEEARRRLVGRADVSGPLVPDAAFRRARAGEFDALVAMYHDQALIPVKLVDFEQAVNVTLGLPVVRTSPDHGVAYDLAGSGNARPHSFIAALDLARQLVARRHAGSSS
ncbi:MAG: 4-hydroxythreonine-4-phosphate dehydrogenase PdxA [Haliangiales bacterium]